MAYRLDGSVTARTSYHYTGGLTTTPTGISTASRPSVTQGNVTVFDLSKRGEVEAEESWGTHKYLSGNKWSSLFTSGITVEESERKEHRKDLSYDGLGRKVKRTFTGIKNIYAKQRKNDGTLTDSADYNSYWFYDKNGNLTNAWDVLPGGTQTVRGNESRNTFEYRYTPTNLERRQEMDVRVRVAAEWEGQPNPDIGRTNGTITSTYNARGLLHKTVTDTAKYKGIESDELPLRHTNTDHAYYADGSKKSVTVDHEDVVEFNYDKHGRVVQTHDSKFSDATDTLIERTVWSTYYAGGKVTETIRKGQSADGEVTYSITEVPTLGGLVYETKKRKSIPMRTTYNAYGQPLSVKGSGSIDHLRNVIDTSYEYNAFGNLKAETMRHEYQKRDVNNVCDGEWTKEDGCSGSWDYETVKLTRHKASSTKYTINQNGDIESEDVFSAESSSPPGIGKGYTKDYVLDSRGNRLGITGDDVRKNKYYGYAKRYDAEGYAAEFDRYPDEKDGWSRAYYLVFRYDPYGSQVLSASAGIGHKVDDEEVYTLERRTYGTYTVQGDVELIVKQQGAVNSTRSCRLFKTFNCSDDEDTWDLAKNRQTWDRSFSLVEGHGSEKWAVLVPFDGVADAALPLEAPTEAISDRLGVVPFDVTAPENALPDLNVGDVTPPEDANETEAPEGETSESGVSTFSITSFDLEPSLPDLNEPPSWTDDIEEDIDATEVDSFSTSNLTLDELPDLNDPIETTPRWTQPSGETFELQAPDSALPESLNATSASEVIAPEGNAKLPPDVGSPSDVLAPGTLTPPNIGAAPSDSATDVLMPEELQAPSIPEIGSGTPDPVGEVAPPEGWTLEGNARDVETFDLASDIEKCNKKYTPSSRKRCYSRTLKDYRNASEEEIKKLLGDFEEEVKGQAIRLANLVAELNDLGGVQISEHNLELVLSTISSLEPSKALVGLFVMNDLIETGKLSASGFNDIANRMRKNSTPNEWDQAYTHIGADVRTLERALGVDLDGFTAAGYFSAIADLVPGAGDLKGIIEAAFGVQLGTNESLAGFARWGGLFGVIGMAELRYGGDLISMLRSGRLFGSYTPRLRNADEAIGCAMSAFRGHSFSEDTPVPTESGMIEIGRLQDKNVEWVHGYDEETGKVGLHRITAFHVHDDPVLTYVTVDADLTDDIPGELIETTPEHPFYVLGEWVDAEDLEVGMPLSTFEGETLVHSGTVTSVERVEQTQTMYNLTVDTAHTFFVGEGQWLVHNTGGGCGVQFTAKQLQKKYQKHAADFGLTGPYNKQNAQLFQETLESHIMNPTTQPIVGTYRTTQNVTHYYDSTTGLNVMSDAVTGEFVSGWRLSTDQIGNLLSNGNVQ